MIVGVALGGALLAAILLLGTVVALSGPTHLLPDGTVTLDGATPADPEGLAAGAGVALDVYALARMVASEAGGQKRIAQIAVASVAMNYTRDRGRRISETLLRRGVKDSETGLFVADPGHGFFGKQRHRYASTSKDPTSGHLDIAANVIAGAFEDPTGGARQWDSPQSYGVQDGTSESDADRVERLRLAAGNEKVLLEGVPERVFRFWRPTEVA